MTKKEIILSLLPIYKRAIEHIKITNDFKTAQNIIAVFRVNKGVCYASIELLGETIYNKKWIKRHNIRGIYAILVWARFPEEAVGIDDMLSLLQWRVDIMEKELKRKWWHIWK